MTSNSTLQLLHQKWERPHNQSQPAGHNGSLWNVITTPWISLVSSSGDANSSATLKVWWWWGVPLLSSFTHIKKNSLFILTTVMWDIKTTGLKLNSEFKNTSWISALELEKFRVVLSVRHMRGEKVRRLEVTTLYPNLSGQLFLCYVLPQPCLKLWLTRAGCLQYRTGEGLERLKTSQQDRTPTAQLEDRNFCISYFNG